MKKVTVLIAVCCGLLAAQTPQWRNLYPSYTALAFGGGKFMAVSSDGLIKTTGDGGESWSQYFDAQGQSLTSAAYGDNMFVVTQNPRRLLLSFDGGVGWTAEMKDNYLCRYLIFGKERFIGIGESGRTFLYSYDREYEFGTWEIVPAEAGYTDLRHAASDNRVFVAVGSNIVSSNDGRGWSARHTAAANLVAYGNDRFVALGTQGGTVYTSDNGTGAWASSSASTLPAGMADIAFGGGKFVAVGNAGAAITSTDGVSWTRSTLNEYDNFKAVKYGEGAGFMALGASGSVYTSPDGSAWTKKADGRTMSYKDIVFGNGKYVAVGDSGASVSTDGLNWSRGAASTGSFRGLQRVAFGNGKFAAVGDSGALYVSDDGAAWSDKSRINRMTFTGVAFGNGKFVVVGHMDNTACIITSENSGQDWAEVTNASSSWPSMYPVSLGYGAGKFVAGSSTGALRSSEAGIYWSNETLPAAVGGSYRYKSVAYINNSGFVVAGATAAEDNFTIITSPDGTNWAAIPPPPSMKVRSVTFAGNFYVAVGDSGKIQASPNGQQWSAQNVATNKNLQTVHVNGNTMIAGGADGALLYSNENPISVRYAQASRGASARALGMTLERTGKTPVISLSFTPRTTGVIEVYSLTGKQLYRKNVGAGERRVSLSRRAAASGSVIVKYTGDGKTVTRRFQMAK